MSALNFDARQVQPDTGVPDPIPAGWYNVIIDQSEMKPTNDGQGAFLECRYNVIDGQYAARKVFSRFNLRNANPQAQEIAHKQLSAVCHAVNMLQVADSQQLHNLPLKIKVSLRPARTDPENGKSYDASNDVKGWKNINEPTDAAAPAGPAAGFAPPPAAWGAPVMPPAMPPAAVAAPWQPQPQAPAPQYAPPPAQAPAPAQYAPQQAPAPAWQPPQQAAQQPWQPQAPQQAAPAPAQYVPPPVAPGAQPPWMVKPPGQ